jgi:hypothetical protein
MNFLSYLGGVPASAKENTAKPSDLEIALARMHSDHTTAMVAIKLLTESVQSSASGNLSMVVVHEERHKDILKNMRELKKEVTASDNRHFAAFELALRPMTRAIQVISDKLNDIDADIHDLHAEIYADREAQARIQNTKLNAIAFQLDTLVTLLAKDLIKHPEGVTVAPPKKKQGRRSGDRNRTLEERYKFLSHRLQVARPNSKARAKYMASLVALRAKMGMAPMSDRALGKEVK